MIVDQIAFSGVSVQMGLGDMKEAAIDGALEQAEIVLDCVGMPEISPKRTPQRND